MAEIGRGDPQVAPREGRWAGAPVPGVATAPLILVGDAASVEMAAAGEWVAAVVHSVRTAAAGAGAGAAAIVGSDLPPCVCGACPSLAGGR